MPKCKNCGEKMPKGFSYCGACGADMITGMIPWTKKNDASNTPKQNVSTNVPKVSMTPSQNIDAFIKSEPIKPVQPTPVAPPKQKFTPVQSVQTVNASAPKVEPIRPIQPTPVAPPQQRFTPVQSIQTVNTSTPKAEPIRPVQPTPVAPPQQRFTPVQSVQTVNASAPKAEPIRPIQPTPVAPPQQKFTPVKPVQTVNTSSKPIQSIQFDTLSTPKMDNIKPVQTPTAVGYQPQKPAYIPKPTPNTAPIEMVKVPDVNGRNQDDARTQLEDLGFKVTIGTENSSAVRQNIVMSQSIRTGTEVTKGSEIKLMVSVGSWTDWSVERIVDTNMYIVEQKKEFRFRSRTREIETHESSERNLPGYTCIDQRKVYSDWEDEGYYTTEDRPTSETCDISTNLIGFKYCGYSYIGAELNINMCYSTKQSALIFNPTTKPEDWNYIETVLYQDIPSETVDWYPNNDMERRTPAGDDIDCNIKMTSYLVDGTRYAMKYGSLGTEWFLYHKRNEIETVYTYKREYFTDWSGWSNWCDKAPIQDELNEVEARILYRGRRKTSKELS